MLCILLAYAKTQWVAICSIRHTGAIAIWHWCQKLDFAKRHVFCENRSRKMSHSVGRMTFFRDFRLG